jgi:Fe-S cluster assembly iron-binding protein IscA
MTIKVTDSAKERVKSLMNDSQFKNPAIRINVSRFG